MVISSEQPDQSNRTSNHRTQSDNVDKDYACVTGYGV